jgi:CRISPR-associated protein Csh1
MIPKLKLLGEYVYKNEGESNPLGLNTSLNEAHVVLLDFKIFDDTYQYLGVDTMQFDQSKNQQLLLKNAKGNTVSEFPTVFVDNIDVRNEVSYDKAVDKVAKKLKRILTANGKINKDLNALAVLFGEVVNEIKEHIKTKLNPDKTNLCSIRINGELVGNSEYYDPVIREAKSSIDRPYYSKYHTVSLGENNTCYVCGRVKEKLYGFTDTFKFYSSNEEAYIAGGFEKSNSWRNYPVCPECATELRLGKIFIQENFNRQFYGNRYFLIPAPMFDRGDFYKILENLMEEYKELSLKQTEESNRQLMMEMEEEIFEEMAKQKDQVTFTFFFYRETNSEFKILQEAEDILPSRFRRIIDAKRRVENFPEFKNLKGLYRKNEFHNLRFNFGIVRTFLGSDFNNDFLDITARILKGSPISKQFILHRISDHLAQGFRKEKMYHDIRKAMILMKFLYELNLIENKPSKMEVKMENKYEEYFQKHPEFYDADWKKAVFLTGVLAQHVMDIQWQERNATPFRSRLNGLKIDQRVVKRLLPEAIEKLEQYKKNYYRELEETIALYLESGEPDLRHESVDEISFYFAMGMNLNKQFKSPKEVEGANNE